jgi:hypothetical protein
MNTSADTNQMSAAPHTAIVAKLLASDELELATAVHEGARHLSGTDDHRLAAVLLGAPWEDFDLPGDDLETPWRELGAQHTIDVADMLCAGHVRAAHAMHAAYETAELERQAFGAEINHVDLWMADALLAVYSAAA